MHVSRCTIFTHGMMMVDMDMLYVGVHFGRHGPLHGLGPYCAEASGSTRHATHIMIERIVFAECALSRSVRQAVIWSEVLSCFPQVF